MAVDRPDFKTNYSSEEFDGLGFHDCHISSIRWEPRDFTVTFLLDYILEWVRPESGDGNFRFWVSPARLCFADVDDLAIELSWRKSAPECHVRELHRRDSRTTPNGSTQWLWEIETSVPSGRIGMWATGFELELLKPPTLSETQRLE